MRVANPVPSDPIHPVVLLETPVETFAVFDDWTG